MENKIAYLVGLMFDDIPYSIETSKAHKKIESALYEKYSELCQSKSEGEALDDIFSEYGQLAQMAELAGYSPKQTKSWRSLGGAIELKPTRKLLNKQRWRTYAAAFFSVAAFMELLWVIYDAFNLNKEFFFVLPFAGLYTFIAFHFIRNIVKAEICGKGLRYDNAAFYYLRSLSDKYTKRLFNSITLLISAVFVFIGSQMSFYFFGNSKSAEFAENSFFNVIIVEIPLFILIKNTILYCIMRRRIDLPEKKKAKKYGILICTFSLVYWIGVTLFTIILSESISYPANIFITAAIVFAAIIMICNLTLRKRITFKNLVLNVKRFSVITSAVVLVTGFTILQRDTWYTQSYINSVPVVKHNTHKIEYNDKTGVYTITSSTEDFKILHLTDIHIGGSLYSYSKDLKALKACYAEIEYTHPDLVVVTGDMCFPMGIMSMSLNNSAPVQQFAAFMRNIGIPWAFT